MGKDVEKKNNNRIITYSLHLIPATTYTCSLVFKQDSLQLSPVCFSAKMIFASMAAACIYTHINSFIQLPIIQKAQSHASTVALISSSDGYIESKGRHISVRCLHFREFILFCSNFWTNFVCGRRCEIAGWYL